MGNRILKETIRTSKTVNGLSDFLFRFWVYLITYVDDYGRGSADPQLLKGFVFPRRDGITEQQITEALQALASKGMIQLYEADEELYFCFPKWEEHQQIRAKKSKFPAPTNNGYQMISDDIRCPRNPIQSNPNPNTNTKENADKPQRFVPPTVNEVRAYCQERNNGIDPEAFIDFYQSKNWKVGKDKMTDWKASVRTWERRRKEEKRGPDSVSGKPETKKFNIVYDA